MRLGKIPGLPLSIKNNIFMLKPFKLVDVFINFFIFSISFLQGYAFCQGEAYQKDPIKRNQ